MARQVNAVPGGGEVGRGARADVRNPALRLPAMQEVLALDPDTPMTRRDLGRILRDFSNQARAEGLRCLARNKWMMLAYWMVCSVYAKHLARAIDPRSR